MKKLVILVLILLTTSCCYSVDELGHKHITYHDTIRYFEHENHEYIEFGVSIVHNPDCPCMNAYKY